MLDTDFKISIAELSSSVALLKNVTSLDDFVWITEVNYRVYTKKMILNMNNILLIQ